MARTQLTSFLSTLALASIAVAQCTPDYLRPSAIAGVNGSVWATTAWDPDGVGPRSPVVVIAGDFTIAGNISAIHVAVWDPASESWSGLGSDLFSAEPWLSSVTSLAVLSNGDLVVAGLVAHVEDPTEGFISRWNGAQWQQLGTVSNGFIFAMAPLPSGELIIGGNFTTADNMPANHIARWDGLTLSAIGPGVDSPVRSLAVLPGGELFAGGFTEVDPDYFTGVVAQWDGANWTSIANNFAQGVWGLATLPNGNLLVAGSIDSAVARLESWNGHAWTSYSSDLPAGINALQLLPNGDALVSTPDISGEPSTFHIVRWNGVSWSSIGGSTDQPANSITVLPSGKLVAGGNFLTVEGKIASCVALWDGSDWNPLSGGLGLAYALPGARALAPLPDGSAVVAGGFFAGERNRPVARMIAQWRNDQWSAYGTGLDFTANAVTAMPNGDIVAAGYFYRAGNLIVDGIARWNGTDWSALGNANLSADGVWTLIGLPNGDLIAGGNFSSIRGVPAKSLARWDGSDWTEFQGGMSLSQNPNGSVQALAISPTGDLLVGGVFDHAGITAASGIARWNGSNWSTFGSGTQGIVSALAYSPDGDLIIGGNFVTAGGVRTGCIARWNGTRWSALGGNVNGWHGGIETITTTSGGDIIVGGQFSAAAGTPARNLARYSNGNWSELVGGADDDVLAMCALPNSDILIAGRFTHLGTTPSFNFARLSCNACPSDFNHDNNIDFFDYLDFVQAFASNDPAADFNHDATIDLFDYLGFVQAFSTGC